MTRLQVVIPMAGEGRRFQRAGYTDPKPLLDVAGKPLIERLLASFPADARTVFIVNERHARETPLLTVLKRLRPEAIIVEIPPHALGPVPTVVGGLSAIVDDLPTIVNYCDFGFSWDFQDFDAFVKGSRCDGAIACYRGFHPHYLRQNLYAYCREENGRVLEVREKGHFTPEPQNEYASSGTYYFSSGALVKRYFPLAMTDEFRINGEFYVSTVYNALLADHRDVRVYEIPWFLQWGTPEDLEDYLYWHRLFARGVHWNARDEGARLVMPMAGLGSRFTHSALPKPLIPVLDHPMFQTAMGFLPSSGRAPVLVLRREIEAPVRAAMPTADLVVLESPTQGQADSTEKAIPRLDLNAPVWVSACDHGLQWDDSAWQAAVASKPDVVIVGQKGYPGARRTPQAFSYIQADARGIVQKVSVKQPLTDRPWQEPVLVGTFYFARARDLANAIRYQKERDVRVNGERYLDSAVNELIERGLRVQLLESQGYLNWGTPDALAEFSYYQRYFEDHQP